MRYFKICIQVISSDVMTFKYCVDTGFNYQHLVLCQYWYMDVIIRVYVSLINNYSKYTIFFLYLRVNESGLLERIKLENGWSKFNIIYSAGLSFTHQGLGRIQT